MEKSKSSNPKRQEIYKVVQKTTKRVNTKKESPWQTSIDANNAPVYAHVLMEKLLRPEQQNDANPVYIGLKRGKYQVPIDDPACRLEDFYTLANMPSVKDWEYKRLNFAFAKEESEQQKAYDAMLNLPKTIVRAYTYKYTDKETNKEYLVLRFYALPQKTNKMSLPTIYRIDILTSPTTEHFYGVRALAVIGGCLDGDCPLFQLNTNDRESARLYKYKSGHTAQKIDPLDDVDNSAYYVREIGGIHDLYEACDYAFKLFNINSRVINALGISKVNSIIETLKRGANITPIQGGHFLKEYMEYLATTSEAMGKQYISANGAVKTSSVHRKRPSSPPPRGL